MMRRPEKKTPSIAGRARGTGANTPATPIPIPTARASPVLWSDRLRWDLDASTAANSILRHNAQELRDEAERVARRAKSESVSVHYVMQASDRLGLHSASGGADVQMAVGGVVLGVAGGFGAALLITPVHIALWLGVLAVVVGILGTAMFSIGCALKMRNR